MLRPGQACLASPLFRLRKEHLVALEAVEECRDALLAVCLANAQAQDALERTTERRTGVDGDGLLFVLTQRHDRRRERENEVDLCADSDAGLRDLPVDLVVHHLC
jgi:hypothetical protein